LAHQGFELSQVERQGQTAQLPTQAVVRNHQVSVATIMKLTMSGDHRVTDGAEVAQFLAEIKRLLENPMPLVFQG
jgi:pyruvate/2-oxoglutarate dehydrogenase complex dihydrolipoamide acyltransferase (E2) component